MILHLNSTEQQLRVMQSGESLCVIGDCSSN